VYNPRNHGPDQAKFELAKKLNPFADTPTLALPALIQPLGWEGLKKR